MKDGFGSREKYVCMPLGEGELDLKRAIRALKGAGYDGVWCVEYEGRDDPAIGYRKGLEYLRKQA
jgi:sugar phosphate isomerase/epimerase